jgi:hypothetical protein
MPKYKITGPVPINGVQPGGFVDRKDLEIPDILLSAGLISPVESDTSSSTTKDAPTSTEGDAA